MSLIQDVAGSGGPDSVPGPPPLSRKNRRELGLVLGGSVRLAQDGRRPGHPAVRPGGELLPVPAPARRSHRDVHAGAQRAARTTGGTAGRVEPSGPRAVPQLPGEPVLQHDRLGPVQPAGVGAGHRAHMADSAAGGQQSCWRRSLASGSGSRLGIGSGANPSTRCPPGSRSPVLHARVLAGHDPADRLRGRRLRFARHLPDRGDLVAGRGHIIPGRMARRRMAHGAARRDADDGLPRRVRAGDAFVAGGRDGRGLPHHRPGQGPVRQVRTPPASPFRTPCCRPSLSFS